MANLFGLARQYWHSRPSPARIIKGNGGFNGGRGSDAEMLTAHLRKLPPLARGPPAGALAAPQPAAPSYSDMKSSAEAGGQKGVNSNSCFLRLNSDVYVNVV